MSHLSDPREQRVHITGIGYSGAAGNGIVQLAQRLRDGDSALRHLSLEERPIPALQVGALLARDWNWRASEGAKTVAAQVLEKAEKLLRGADAALRADAAALLEAKGGAHIAPERLGLVVGGSNLAHLMLCDEMARFGRNPAFANPRIGFHALDTHVAATLAALAEARGPVMNVAAAAASGAVAAVAALDLIRAGRCDACLAVGAMQRLSPMDWHALAALGALNVASEMPVPFGGSGNGFAPGEGATCILLERADPTRHQQRGSAGLAELAGGAFISGADPLPHPCRQDESRVMALALADAGIELGQVDLITAHATGTAKGDEAEAGALADLFGTALEQVWVAAPKAVTGHCLGASGMVGLVASVLMLGENRVYPLPKSSASQFATLRLAIGGAVDAPLRCAVSNAFGFGGFNACLVLRTLAP